MNSTHKNELKIKKVKKKNCVGLSSH